MRTHSMPSLSVYLIILLQFTYCPPPYHIRLKGFPSLPSSILARADGYTIIVHHPALGMPKNTRVRSPLSFCVVIVVVRACPEFVRIVVVRARFEFVFAEGNDARNAAEEGKFSRARSVGRTPRQVTCGVRVCECGPGGGRQERVGCHVARPTFDLQQTYNLFISCSYSSTTGHMSIDHCKPFQCKKIQG